MVVAHPVPSAIVVHRNRDVNAPKVHCPKAGRHVEKQHHMMNRRAESVVGGTVGAHAKAHHHEVGAAHDEQTKCSTANTEPTTTVRTAHVDSPPPTRHMAWEENLLLFRFVVHGNIPTATLHRVSYVMKRHQRQMPIPRLLLMARTFYDREHMAQSRGKRV